MKDKDKPSQKKSTGSARVRSAKRPASGSSTRRIEIKHAEEALRASEKKFSAIFNASPDQLPLRISRPAGSLHSMKLPRNGSGARARKRSG